MHSLSKPAESPNEFCRYGHLIGNSTTMQTLYHIVERVSKTSASVFVIGESGTGKELIAHALHQHSLRKSAPFIAINCGSISSDLIASALFGHEKGSFTGAIQAHKGYFEQASGGTLFLDEVTETSQDFQVKLLRVLETGVINPVGGKREIAVDVRIIASTNRDPELAIQQGVLRKDLYHRLNVFPIHTPSLNQHKEDIHLLAQYFLSTLNKEYNRKTKFTQKALEALEELHYAGNIRELKNIVHRAYILADEMIDVNHIQPETFSPIETLCDTIALPTNATLEEVELQFIHHVLQKNNNDAVLAAASLGISLRKLNQFLV